MLFVMMMLMSTSSPAFVDPTIKPYVDRFNEYAKQVNSNSVNKRVSAFFGKPSTPNHGNFTVIGECDYNNLSIVVEHNHWNMSSDIHREILILHEMGHCVLERGHKNSYRNDIDRLIPSSLMGATNFVTDQNYIKYKWLYIDELFHPERYD